MYENLASLSLDLDNKWSYLKTHGDKGWEEFPSYLDIVVPRVLQFLDQRQLKITFFVVGQDAALPANSPVLKSIADAGHEIGNHSFHHEPWLHLYSPSEIATEISQAESAIIAATGSKPIGFRGPGFSVSPPVLAELVRQGYQYDCSTFPTFLGPLARMYYFFSAKLSSEQKKERKQLFGKAKEGFLPLRPYMRDTQAGPLVEIPVTTMPVLKLPIHVSYLLYLARYSRALALAYWKFSLALCSLFRVQPSILLHPLDFLGHDEEQDLAFFPAMDRTSAWKVAFVTEIIDVLQRKFQIVTMAQHCETCQVKMLEVQSPSA
jgi:peptidoglycan-N-acetylglucosamine deacetylase